MRSGILFNPAGVSAGLFVITDPDKEKIPCTGFQFRSVLVLFHLRKDTAGCLIPFQFNRHGRKSGQRSRKESHIRNPPSAGNFFRFRIRPGRSETGPLTLNLIFRTEQEKTMMTPLSGLFVLSVRILSEFCPGFVRSKNPYFSTFFGFCPFVPLLEHFYTYTYTYVYIVQ